MPEAILRLEDVVRDFKRQTETIHAVRGVSLEIRRGLIFCADDPAPGKRRF